MCLERKTAGRRKNTSVVIGPPSQHFIKWRNRRIALIHLRKSLWGGSKEKDCIETGKDPKKIETLEG